MSKFSSDLKYQKVQSGLYRISESVRFYSTETKYGKYIEIPEGSITNFASIPQFIQFLFPIDHEDYKMAAAFHDYLVGEFNTKRGSVRSNYGFELYSPSWGESARWFRKMISVKQKLRRQKRQTYKKNLGAMPDFFTRWIFYYSVLFYGLIK